MRTGRPPIEPAPAGGAEADSAAGCAVQSMLPGAIGYSTIEIKVSFISPLRAEGGEVAVVGRVLRLGRRVAFAEAHARDGAGALVAHATTSLAAVVDQPGPATPTNPEATASEQPEQARQPRQPGQPDPAREGPTGRDPAGPS